MAACTLFEEDEVCLVTPDKGYIYGLVLENSEFLSSDEEDDDDLAGQIKKGTVRVAWHPDGKETVVPENKVILVDRSLMPGDVVRRLISNEDSQRGFVKDGSVLCHLHIMETDKYIYNIDSKDLLPLTYFDPDPGEVTLDSWVGRIDALNEDITLRFPDGARCIISDADVCCLEDAVEKRERPSEFCKDEMYPGRQLKGYMDDLTDVKWLKETSLYNQANIKSKPRMTIYVTVEEVTTRNVEVHWHCHGFSKVSNPLDKMSPPDRIVQGEDLKRLQLLDWFAHCSVQIGDRAYYTIKENDILETTRPKRHFAPHVMAKLSETDLETCSTDKVFKCKKNKKCDCLQCVEKNAEKEESEASGETVQEAETNGVVVDEAEGEYEDVDDTDDDSDCKSEDSGPSKHNSSRKGAKKGPSVATRRLKKVKGRRPKKKTKMPELVVNVGDKVAVEICYTYTTASVVWQDGTEEENIPSPELFPIHHLDELEYFPGDYVADSKDPAKAHDYGLVLSCDHRERTCRVQWMKPYKVGKGSKPMQNSETIEMSVYDVKDHPDYKFRPGHSVIRVGGFEDRDQELYAVGQVLKLDTGEGIQVKWPDGSVTSCFPQDLYIVNGDDDLSEDDSSEWDSSSSESDASSDTSWETENEEELVDGQEEEAEADNSDEAFTMLCAHVKSELDALLIKAQTALSKLESLFQGLDTHMPSAITCYQDILRIYKLCKELDKILKSRFFDDEELTNLITKVRQEIKNEKSRKVARHLRQMFQSWHQGLSENCVDEGQCEDDDESMVDARSLPGEIERSMCTGEKNGLPTPTEEDLLLNQKKCSKKGDEDSNTSNDSGTDISMFNNEVNCDKLSPNSIDLTKSDTDSGVSGATAMNDQTEDDAPINKTATELCLKICQRLHILIAKILEEVKLRWKKSDQKNKTAKGGEESVVEKTEALSVNTEESPAPCSDSGAEKNEVTENSKSPDSKMHQESDVEKTEVTKNGEGSEPESVPTNIETDKKSENEEKQVGFKLDEEIEKMDDSSTKNPSSAFLIDGEAPPSHKFRPQKHEPNDLRSFMTAVRKELKLLRTSLPDGITVKSFEDRMDLYSVMIIGPTNTPYEDGLFFFDVQLPNDYPHSPPVFHYHSYCADRLNPNLYEDGKVCVSLLGTWSGKGNEVWTSKSNLLQVLVSIQGLILVGEPYYNEAGYERQRGTQHGMENSRMYNEMAILKLMQCMTRMVKYPPDVFKDETIKHLKIQGPRMISRLLTLIESSPDKAPCSSESVSNNGLSSEAACNLNNSSTSSSEPGIPEDHTPQSVNEKLLEASSTQADVRKKKPDFPIFPISKGFRLSMKSHLEQFRKSLESLASQTEL